MDSKPHFVTAFMGGYKNRDLIAVDNTGKQWIGYQDEDGAPFWVLLEEEEYTKQIISVENGLVVDRKKRLPPHPEA